MSDNPFVGSWTYRSLLNDTDMNTSFNDLQFGLGTIVIEEAPMQLLKGTIGGPGWSLDLKGAREYGNPMHVRFQGKGVVSGEEWIYDYDGYLVPAWPNGVQQVPAMVGSIVRTVPHSGSAAEGQAAADQSRRRSGLVVRREGELMDCWGRRHFDVLIAGAGPAGAATAISLVDFAPNLNVGTRRCVATGRAARWRDLAAAIKPTLEHLGVWRRVRGGRTSAVLSHGERLGRAGAAEQRVPVPGRIRSVGGSTVRASTRCCGRRRQRATHMAAKVSEMARDGAWCAASRQRYQCKRRASWSMQPAAARYWRARTASRSKTSTGWSAAWCCSRKRPMTAPGC